MYIRPRLRAAFSDSFMNKNFRDQLYPLFLVLSVSDSRSGGKASPPRFSPRKSSCTRCSAGALASQAVRPVSCHVITDTRRSNCHAIITEVDVAAAPAAACPKPRPNSKTTLITDFYTADNASTNHRINNKYRA